MKVHLYWTNEEGIARNELLTFPAVPRIGEHIVRRDLGNCCLRVDSVVYESSRHSGFEIDIYAHLVSVTEPTKLWKDRAGDWNNIDPGDKPGSF